MTLEETFKTMSKLLLLALAIFGVGVVGIFDFITGYQVSFFLFYGVPILFSVWFLNRACTGLIVLLSAVAWSWADRASGHLYFTNWLEIWETTFRLVFFVFIAVGGTAMKSRRDSMLERLTNMNRMRELEREVVAASERERHRIGADLHDGLCQYLAGLTCMTKSLHEDLTRHADPLAGTAGELDTMLKDAVVQARNIARGIAPVQMDEDGLVFALDELSATVRRIQNIHCEFDSEGDVRVGDCEMATHLYYIAQEAVSNAIRHGKPATIFIGLQTEDRQLILSIEDNGVGIRENCEPAAGMGLRTMRYRAGVLDGELTITGRPGGGVRVSCHVPLAAPEEKKSTEYAKPAESPHPIHAT
jgi:signal transduction histidine kinase